jgi:hypothetical protein
MEKYHPICRRPETMMIQTGKKQTSSGWDYKKLNNQACLLGLMTPKEFAVQSAGTDGIFS